MKPVAHPGQAHDGTRFTHGLFNVMVILKGVNGLLELGGGLALLLFQAGAIDGLVHALTASELAEDPTDPIANTLNQWAEHLGHETQVLAAAYLLFHGIVKLCLAGLLLRGKIWAYPAAVTFFAIFIAYMLFRLSRNWSWPLSGLVVFDLLTVTVILLDWRATGWARA
ncbi:MAG TPA: DUF2127 domain-containing protein [Dongiaceae bacterium]|nr:DUF2127 domain-containing protein [Dongiaceae bacterium]